MRRLTGGSSHLILTGLLSAAALAGPLPERLDAAPGRGSSPGLTDEDSGALVTEAELLDAVAGDHPALIALTGELGAARADLIEASTLPDPEVSVAREGPTGGVEQVDLTLSWQPPRPDRRRLAVETARAEVTAADARLEARRLDLRLHLRAV
ncbi:MAG: hypothetical protein PVG07_04505, partial [Acidobacteriota bacterium]